MTRNTWGRAMVLAALGFFGLSRYGPGQTASESTPPTAAVAYIDAHTHFDEHDPQGTVESILRAVPRENASKIYLQIPPFGVDDPLVYDAEVILAAAKGHADHVGVLGGGGSLNPMIMRSVMTGDAGPLVRQKFKERAEELLRLGVAGFGEMTAEHFVGATPYQYAPPDHPLYLLLADIAGARGVPIDIHMEAVPRAMALPAPLKSPPNAAELHENIAAFERLLAHNRRTKIIWAHLGTDNTGFRTPDESRRLLRAHANLYLEIKYDPLGIGRNPVMVNGMVTPEWLKVFQEFPDRFIIGSDQHYPEEGQPARWPSVVTILNQLPPAVRQKIAADNARRVFAGAAESAGR